MYKATIDKKDFEVAFQQEGKSKGEINHKPFDIDILPINQQVFSILYKGKSYTAEIIGESENNGKELNLKIGGKRAKVILQDKYDILLKKMGFDFSSTAKLTNLKAPMPGKVIDVLVKPGDTVQKGDGLLILEAMKMENIIKATGEGIIKEISVTKDNTVEKGALLIKFQ